MKKQWILWMFAYATMHVVQPAFSGHKEDLVNLLKGEHIQNVSTEMSEEELEKKYVDYFCSLKKEDAQYDALIRCEKNIGKEKIDTLVTQCIQALSDVPRSRLVYYMARKDNKKWVEQGIEFTPKGIGFPYIVYECAKQGWKELVIKYLDKVQDSKEYPEIIALCAKQGWKELVIKYLDKVQDSKEYPEIIALCAKKGWKDPVIKYKAGIRLGKSDGLRVLELVYLFKYTFDKDTLSRLNVSDDMSDDQLREKFVKELCSLALEKKLKLEECGAFLYRHIFGCKKYMGVKETTAFFRYCIQAFPDPQRQGLLYYMATRPNLRSDEYDNLLLGMDSMEDVSFLIPLLNSCMKNKMKHYVADALYLGTVQDSKEFPEIIALYLSTEGVNIRIPFLKHHLGTAQIQNSDKFLEIITLCVKHGLRESLTTEYLDKLQESDKFPEIIALCAKQGWQELVIEHLDKVQDSDKFPEIIALCAKQGLGWGELVIKYLDKLQDSDKFPEIIALCAKHGWWWSKELVIKYLDKVQDSDKFPEIIALCAENGWKNLIEPEYLDKVQKSKTTMHVAQPAFSGPKYKSKESASFEKNSSMIYPKEELDLKNLELDLKNLKINDKDAFNESESIIPEHYQKKFAFSGPKYKSKESASFEKNSSMMNAEYSQNKFYPKEELDLKNLKINDKDSFNESAKKKFLESVEKKFLEDELYLKNLQMSLKKFKTVSKFTGINGHYAVHHSGSFHLDEDDFHVRLGISLWDGNDEFQKALKKIPPKRLAGDKSIKSNAPMLGNLQSHQSYFISRDVATNLLHSENRIKVESSSKLLQQLRNTSLDMDRFLDDEGKQIYRHTAFLLESKDENNTPSSESNYVTKLLIDTEYQKTAAKTYLKKLLIDAEYQKTAAIQDEGAIGYFYWLFYKLRTPIEALSIFKDQKGSIEIESFTTSSFACVFGKFQGKLLAVFPFEDNMQKKMLGEV
jgi:hypothetical protein